MMKKIIATSLALVVLMATPGLTQGIPVNAQISVDAVDATPGSHFGVRIFLNNNSTSIAALSIPLTWFGTSLSLDSVSFVNTLKTDDFTGTAHQDDPTSVFVTYIPAVLAAPLPIITDPSGILAELFFTLAADAPQGVIVLDSTNDIMGGRSLNFADPTGQIVYLPRFAPGAVIVGAPTAVDDRSKNSSLPADFALGQNYPNPFNPTTILEFALPYASSVKLEVFNVLGQKVITLADGRFSAGIHQVEYDASRQPSGLYFYRFTYEGGAETKKMVLIK